MSSDGNGVGRRRFLKGAASTTVAAMGMSGCVETDSGEDSTETPSGTEPSETSSIEILNSDIEVEWTPEIHNKEDFDPEEVLSISVDPEQNDPANLEVLVNTEDEETEISLDNDERGDLKGQITPDELQEGTNNVKLVDSTEGDTLDQEEVTKTTPDSYRVDRKRKSHQDAEIREVNSELSTIYTYDNHVLNEQEFDGRRQEWLQDTAYNDFLQNPQYWELEEDWSQKTVETEEDYVEVLREGVTAVRKRNKENPQYNDAPSAGFAEIASTTELLFQEERNENLLSGSMTVAGGHGLTIFYDQQHGWHVADTTGTSIAKPGSRALQNVDQWWIPWSDYGADVDKSAEPSYSTKKGDARMGLLSLISPKLRDVYSDKILLSDQWDKQAYEHIRNDGDAETILKPLEEAVDKQIEEGGYPDGGHIVVYGDLENSRVAYGEDLSDLEDKIMSEDHSLSVEEVESYLEPAAVAA